MKILILPGIDNSGPAHWQSLWEASLPNAERVQQRDWAQPQREDWVAALSAAVNASQQEVVLVAHSLGCALVAWWVALDMPGVHDKQRVKAALLVAPPDVERREFPAASFAPMPLTRLPFASKIVASENDIWCEMPRAQAWAQAWGGEFHHLGARGHINGESGLGAWQQGRHWLNELTES
ncbi:MAG: alpha/beta hydrolase [Burkholderiales bacterium]|nr:alpha/beta hydrolase [Burkholderiales bacterium]